MKKIPDFPDITRLNIPTPLLTDQEIAKGKGWAREVSQAQSGTKQLVRASGQSDTGSSCSNPSKRRITQDIGDIESRDLPKLKRYARAAEPVESEIDQSEFGFHELIVMPKELVEKIYSNMAPRDIVNISLTCKSAYVFFQNIYPDKSLLRRAHELFSAEYSPLFNPIGILDYLYKGGDEGARWQQLHSVTNETMRTARRNKYCANALIHSLMADAKIVWALKDDVSINDKKTPGKYKFGVDCCAVFIKNMIQLHDINKGDCIRYLDGHNNWVSSIIEISDSLLASGCEGGEIRIWNTDTGECLKTLSDHVTGDEVCLDSDTTGRGIRCLASLPEDRFASGDDKGTIRIWNSKTQEAFLQLRMQSARVWLLCPLR